MEVEETTPLSCDSAEPTASQKQRAEHKNKHASCVYMDRVFVSQCQDAWRIDVGEEWRSQPSFSMETEDEEEAIDRVRAGQESFTGAVLLSIYCIMRSSMCALSVLLCVFSAFVCLLCVLVVPRGCTHWCRYPSV